MAAVFVAAFLGSVIAAAARRSQFRREANDVFRLYRCLALYKKSLDELVDNVQVEKHESPRRVKISQFVRKRNQLHNATTEQVCLRELG